MAEISRHEAFAPSKAHNDYRLVVSFHSPLMQGREHLDFLLRLKDVMSLRSAFLSQLETVITKQGFELKVKTPPQYCCSAFRLF